MGLDIKVPIGLMFTILGLLLAIYGLATADNAELYERSLNININLWTGLSMLVIGLLMLLSSKLKPAKKDEEPPAE